MKKFTQDQVEAAVEHARQGGQALHLHRLIVDRRKAPSCFVRAVDKGEDIAHLFDQSYFRLIATARRLGVRVILVEREGEPGQHIDLCGAPLRAAIKECT